MLGCGLGGIEQALIDYCEALMLTGHEVVAVVHPKAAIIPALQQHKISMHRLPNWGAWDPIAILRLRQMLSHIKPDACIAHGNRALSLLKTANAPRTIAVMHNYKIKCEGVRFVFYPTQDLLRHVNAKQLQNMDAYLIPNMVRVPAQSPQHSWRAPPVIGSMGRFVAKKGFDLFIEALALLKARNIPFRALLAGDGEETLALKQLAAAKGLESQLQFTGWVGDKKAFFDSIDVFCLPSHHEPFGIVLLEAMAHALPVVATRSEGPSEILQLDTDGILVPKENPQALGDALKTLLTEPEYALKAGRNAYITVKNRYDLPVIARQLDLALQALCRL